MDFERFEVDLVAYCPCGCMEGNRFHKVYRFPNDYGASVISNPKKEGFVSGGYSILLLSYEKEPPDNEYRIENNGRVPEDVLECRNWQEVKRSLEYIMNLQE